MATNFFFNNFRSSQEQLLIEDLIVESIKIYGHDIFYIPRRLIEQDEVYGEDPVSEYTARYSMEMYIKNIEGFGGDGDFLSKFNLQIRDNMTLTIARRIFFDEIGPETQVRPNEGDLIYFPLNKKLFEIKFVEHEAIFYQLGALQTFDLRCELFEYNNQILNTGIPEIDNIQRDFTLALNNESVLTELGYALVDESGFGIILEEWNFQDNVDDKLEDNTEIQAESDNFVDFTERDPFSEGVF